MKLHPFHRPASSLDYIPLTVFARESGLPKSTIRDRAARGLISRHWQDYRTDGYTGRNLPKRWVYFVGDMPESCGSHFLANYYERVGQRAEREAREANEALDRVIRFRRAEVAA